MTGATAQARFLWRYRRRDLECVCGRLIPVGEMHAEQGDVHLCARCVERSGVVVFFRQVGDDGHEYVAVAPDAIERHRSAERNRRYEKAQSTRQAREQQQAAIWWHTIATFDSACQQCAHTILTGRCFAFRYEPHAVWCCACGEAAGVETKPSKRYRQQLDQERQERDR